MPLGNRWFAKAIKMFFKQEVTQEGSLPLRQVRANCDCLHSGERSHGHFVSNVELVGSKLAIDKSGYLNIKEKADMAPAQAKAIDILMEITLKDKLAQELFSRMKMTFTLALKSLLEKVWMDRSANLLRTSQRCKFTLNCCR